MIYKLLICINEEIKCHLIYIVINFPEHNGHGWILGSWVQVPRQSLISERRPTTVDSSSSFTLVLTSVLSEGILPTRLELNFNSSKCSVRKEVCY